MTSVLPDFAGLTYGYSAHNYAPLPVVVASASGAWVTDVTGRRYLDMLAGYSALNFGHLHPRLVAAAVAQLQRATLVSRAFDHDQFGPFCAELARSLSSRGFEPVPVDMSELLKAGGGAKCCTLELRR